MSFLQNLFGAPQKPKTMLNDVQEVGGRLIVKGYRRIAAQHGCAPTSKTTDEKIIEIYTLVTTAFHQAAARRGERIPALFDNYIVLKFFQVHEMMGDHLQRHLQYEVEKYLREGLREDYRKELQLFDPNGNDPDVKRLKELQRISEKQVRPNMASQYPERNSDKWDFVIQDIVKRFREHRTVWFAACVVLMKDNPNLRANPRLEGRAEIASWVYQCAMALAFIAETRYIAQEDRRNFATLLFTALSRDGQQNPSLANDLYRLQSAALERNDGSDIAELCGLIVEQILCETDALAAMKLAKTIPLFTKLSNCAVAQAFGDTVMVNRLMNR